MTGRVRHAFGPCIVSGTAIVLQRTADINQCVAMATLLDAVMGGSMRSPGESALLLGAKSTDVDPKRYWQSPINLHYVLITI